MQQQWSITWRIVSRRQRVGTVRRKRLRLRFEFAGAMSAKMTLKSEKATIFRQRLASIRASMYLATERQREFSETISRKKSVNRRPRIGMKMVTMYAEM